VDECVSIAKLEFDRSPDVVEPDNAGMLFGNLESAFEASQVVVGHFQNEQVFKYVAVHKMEDYIRAWRNKS
jgi:hypothetical protein